MIIFLFENKTINNMIEINDRRKVYSIQNEFSKLFPNLKIEFYSKSHKSGGALSRRMVKTSNKTLGECRTVHNSGEMIISSNMTIAELESYFSDSYGLGIKVFGKEDGGRIQLTNLNKLSLQEQN